MVSPKYFRRDRILTFSSMMAMFINRIVKGISIEICNFLNGIKSDLTCTKQAFSKARKKFRHTAFIELNEAFAQNFYARGVFLPFEGIYRLLAVDGSLCQLPESEDVAKSFGRWKNQTDKGMPMGRASLVYDVVNRVAINGKLESIDRCETDIFREQYGQVPSVGRDGIRDIYVMDRGYPSHDLCTMLSEGGDLFVIRCKKDFNAALSSFVSSGKLMDAIELRGSTWYTKDGKKKGSRYPAPLMVTAVRVELPDGQPEYLITNLEGQDIAFFKRLYGPRPWPRA